jgi:ligand-binding sensor domain-containing protein
MRFNEGTGATVAIGGSVVYISRDSGSPGTWSKPLSLPVVNGEYVSAVFLPDSRNVYVGTTKGQLFHISWSRSRWRGSAALSSPPTIASISDLIVDPKNPKRMWVTYATWKGGSVYRSDDGGSHWIDCSSGLPTLPINAIEVDSRDPNRVWVAALLGVFESRDKGTTWTNFSAKLPNVRITDLLFHPVAFLLRAATANRGVWEIDIGG